MNEFHPGHHYELLRAFDAATGRELAVVARARTRKANRQGLLGRDSLQPGWGLLLADSVVHMVGMRFALDIVFLNRKSQVVKVAENVRPGLRLRGSLRARRCLELPAGAAGAAGIARGGVLHFEAL